MNKLDVRLRQLELLRAILSSAVLLAAFLTQIEGCKREARLETSAAETARQIAKIESVVFIPEGNEHDGK